MSTNGNFDIGCVVPEITAIYDQFLVSSARLGNKVCYSYGAAGIILPGRIVNIVTSAC